MLSYSLYIYSRQPVKKVTMRCHHVRRGGGSGGLASPVIGWRVLGVRVAPRGHSAPLQLDVDHLANGLEQLHAVVKKT